MIVMRFALPVRSPIPFIVPCTCVAPASTAMRLLATAQPPSSWQWMPSATPGSAWAMSATAAATWLGREGPLVSHRTRRSAPAFAAARRQSSA